MVDEGRRTGSPFDEGRLQLVREFLHREFRDCHHRDFFAFDQAAQVFLVETGRGFRYMLVIPKATFEDDGLPRLCNAQLAATLKLSREGRVTFDSAGTSGARVNTPRRPEPWLASSMQFGMVLVVRYR
jgi:hypothetical protein